MRLTLQPGCPHSGDRVWNEADGSNSFPTSEHSVLTLTARNSVAFEASRRVSSLASAQASGCLHDGRSWQVEICRYAAQLVRCGGQRVAVVNDEAGVVDVRRFGG